MTGLTDAEVLAARNPTRWPHESAAYRTARTALLAEEIALRRQIERVAAQRRTLPPGGEVRGDYRFATPDGETDFAGLFGEHDTLAVYSFMFGPDRERPCPMCTSLIGAIDHGVPDLEQRLGFVAVIRSPLARMDGFRRERGWHNVRFVQDLNDNYSRDYHGLMPDGGDGAELSIFTRADGVIRHFWGGEMTDAVSDPGQDPRGAPDLQPLWTLLDLTPEGRPADWYPSLDYPEAGAARKD